MAFTSNSREIILLNTIGSLNTFFIPGLIGQKRNKLITDYHNRILNNGDIFENIDKFCTRIKKEQCGIGPVIEQRLKDDLPRHFNNLRQANLPRHNINNLRQANLPLHNINYLLQVINRLQQENIMLRQSNNRER